MRTALAAAAILAGAFAACASAVAPPPDPLPLKPKTVAVAGPVGTAPGDTLAYSLRWGRGDRAASYRVTVTASPSAGWAGLPTAASVTDTVLAFAARSTTWDSVRFTARVWSVSSRGWPSRDTATVSWSVVRSPGAPGPIVVDSSLVIAAVELTPPSVTVATAGQQRFCPYIRFGDGVVARRTIDAACEADYVARFGPAERAVRGDQQITADFVCLDWDATGGTVAGGGCDRVRVPS